MPSNRTSDLALAIRVTLVLGLRGEESVCHQSCPLCGIQHSPATRSGGCWACMATILLLIAAVLAVTSAVGMLWIRVAAADHRQRWNLPDHRRLEP